MRFGPQYVSLEPPPQGCESGALRFSELLGVWPLFLWCMVSAVVVVKGI